MPYEQVEPTCRYNHGKLVLEDSPSDPSTSGWGLRSFAFFDLPPDENDSVWTVKVYKCPVCGYVELFDKDFK